MRLRACYLVVQKPLWTLEAESGLYRELGVKKCQKGCRRCQRLKLVFRLITRVLVQSQKDTAGLIRKLWETGANGF